MKINLIQTVADYLRDHPGRKLTARELAIWAAETYPEWAQRKKEESSAVDTDNELISQISSEISAGRRSLQRRYHIERTEGYPRRYFWTIETDQDEINEVEPDSQRDTLPSQDGLTERDLYPMLFKFLAKECRVRPKRINEQTSSGKQGPKGNKWLHPDIVGMEDLTTGWHREIDEVVKEYGDRKVRIWSFEVKLTLSRSSVREYFFQAISNSSWANFGYLVTANITGEGTMEELRILSDLHGIGLIMLDQENPIESQILIPAKERTAIDWATCNRVAKENKDFRLFIKQVKNFYRTKDINASAWDAQIEQ